MARVRMATQWGSLWLTVDTVLGAESLADLGSTDRIGPSCALLHFVPPTHHFSIHFITKDIYMPRPRVPLIKAQATGRTTRNPGRFKDRKEPPSPGALGSPPKWFKTDAQKEAWNTFA